jgi:hypothetical protein
MNVATNSAACDIASSRLDVAADVSTRNVPGRDVYVSLHGTAYIDSITRVNVQLSDVSFNADSNLLPFGIYFLPVDEDSIVRDANVHPGIRDAVDRDTSGHQNLQCPWQDLHLQQPG